jgi:hypothetical protein
MTLYELKGKYDRLSNEIDTLATDGVRHEARLMRLMNDLDQVHRQLCDLRLRTFGAPTLRDVVSQAEPVASKAVVVPIASAAAVPLAAPSMRAPALSMAG